MTDWDFLFLWLLSQKKNDQQQPLSEKKQKINRIIFITLWTLMVISIGAVIYILFFYENKTF
jgi:flagellar basal body-associated protein FliL